MFSTWVSRSKSSILPNALSGSPDLEPGRDIQISYTGIRPGERLNEILFARGKRPSDIGIPGIVAAKPVRPPLDAIRAWVATLEQGVARGERAAIYNVLRDAVPEFRGEAA